ncbi:hypothetical protein PACTADRAFT_45868 [Pachysolen tannophilus NRRL Y-2460]|uniref:Uncharacterized protein n=1 Tax=Pachysolen tannophilus NRRL Y-2460 TaxID=669874 RepID=A0A1E4TPI5_PACTA|nr:hypothetical protein PACTADRAFT_45868 [Pachysolen tannophilus NRRL Y-2460]
MFEKIRKNSPIVDKTISIIAKFTEKTWFFIGLAIFIALAHSFPNVARQGGYIKAQYTIGYLAVAIIFFISGLSMKTKQLAVNMANWRAHFTVLTLSFLITSSIIYGICCAIKHANNSQISEWMLVGLIVTSCCPTTVASNVVMTRAADGNELLSLSEVFIGNLLGAFITPALVQLYTRGEWAFANPAQGTSVLAVYREVMKQTGCSVFVPLFIGQIVQNIFPNTVKWYLTTFKLNKLGTFMLLLIMWSSFSTAFHQHAFTEVPTASILLIVFFNIGIYIFFTIICYLYSRPAFLLKIFDQEPSNDHSNFYNWSYKFFKPFYYNREDTVSVMLCGAAKTAALGVTLTTAQYGGDNANIGKLLVPLVLYQSEQVVCAGILTEFMKKWVHAGPEYIQKVKEKEMAEIEMENKNSNSCKKINQNAVGSSNEIQQNPITTITTQENNTIAQNSVENVENTDTESRSTMDYKATA